MSVCRIELTARECSRDNWNAVFKIYKRKYFVQGQTSRLNAQIQCFWRKCSKTPSVTFMGPTQIRILGSESIRNRYKHRFGRYWLIFSGLPSVIRKTKFPVHSITYSECSVYSIAQTVAWQRNSFFVAHIFIAIFRKKIFFGRFENTFYFGLVF